MSRSIFVGTLFSGEGDYNDCINSILEQKNVTITHKLIANHPEKEAHNILWNSWKNVQNDGYKAFIKIDADIILSHDHVLNEIINLFEQNPEITHVQAPLYDFFTDDLLVGINCYSPSVVFTNSNDNLFCDRNMDTNHKIHLRAENVPQSLKPAGFHCTKATELQAFHYGVHRALKGQQDVLTKVYASFIKTHNILKYLVLLGASRAHVFINGGFNYTDDLLKKEFENALQLARKILNKN